MGEWLGTQRKYKRKGTLPEAKLARLQGLVDAGRMTWSPAVSRLQSDNQHWDHMYTLLLEFGEREGHYNVLERYVVEDQPQQVLLGKWLGRQREQWRRGTLHSDRADRLQTLVNSGLFYTNGTAEDEARWQRHYEALLQFNEQFEHCNVPYSYYCCVPIATEAAAKGSPDNEAKNSKNSRETENFEVLKLGAWLNNQRQARRRSQQQGATSGQLRPDRLALLQVLCVLAIICSYV